MRFLCESHAAVRAVERFFICVDPQVSVQFAFLGEGLAANWAAEEVDMDGCLESAGIFTDILQVYI